MKELEALMDAIKAAGMERHIPEHIWYAALAAIAKTEAELERLGAMGLAWR